MNRRTPKARLRSRLPLALAAVGVAAILATVVPVGPASAAGAPSLERMLGWVERNNDFDSEFRADLVIRVPQGERPTLVRYDWNLDGTLDVTASLATGPGIDQQYQIVSVTPDGDEDLLVLTVRGDADYPVATCTNQPVVRDNRLQITVPSGVIEVTGFSTTITNFDPCTQNTSRPFVRIPWDNAWGSPAGTSAGAWGAIVNTTGTLAADLAIVDADNPNNGGLAANCGITDSVSYQWFKETSAGVFSPSGSLTTTAVTPHHASISGALRLGAQSFPSDGYYKLLAWPNAKSSAGGADCSARTYTPGNADEAFVIGSVFNNFVPLSMTADCTFAGGAEAAPYTSAAPSASGGDGGPYTWTTTSTLPAGLTLDASTGVISGTPGTGSAGTYPVTLTATDGDGATATCADDLVIAPPAGVPMIDLRVGAALASLAAVGAFGLHRRRSATA